MKKLKKFLANWTMIVAYAVTGVVLTIAAWMANVESQYFSLTWATLFLVLGHFAFSFRISRNDELAFVVLLGKPLYNVGPGPHFVPFGITWLQIFTRNVIQEEIPAPLEKIWDGEAKDRPEDQTNPLRITTGGTDPEETGEDSLNNRVTAEPVAILRYRIGNPILFQRAIGDIKRASIQLHDSTVIAITDAYSQRSPKKIIDEMSSINSDLVVTAEKLTGERCLHCGERREKAEGDSGVLCSEKREGEQKSHGFKPLWGVDVIEVSIKVNGMPRRVNEALANTIQEGELAKQTKIRAGAEEVRLTKEGQGQAAARAALLEALNMKDGAELLSLEAARDLAGNSRTFVFADKDGGDTLGNLGKLFQTRLATELADQDADEEGDSR